MLKFTSVRAVEKKRRIVGGFVRQAIEVERAGAKVQPTAAREPMPPELERSLAADPELACAFESLTPGRQRSYILHVAGAKQSATRQRRAERCAPKILSGKGFNER